MSLELLAPTQLPRGLLLPPWFDISSRLRLRSTRFQKTTSAAHITISAPSLGHMDPSSVQHGQTRTFPTVLAAHIAPLHVKMLTLTGLKLAKESRSVPCRTLMIRRLVLNGQAPNPGGASRPSRLTMPQFRYSMLRQQQPIYECEVDMLPCDSTVS
jgi:hypothetical protein